jgi:sodium/pantothenate symporter
MVWLNLFASAGQISTFLWPTILGLYWKRANKQGAIASMVSGIGVYMFCNYFWPRPFGFHPITLSVAVSLLGFVAVTYMFEKPSDELVEKFWGI